MPGEATSTCMVLQFTSCLLSTTKITLVLILLMMGANLNALYTMWVTNMYSIYIFSAQTISATPRHLIKARAGARINSGPVPSTTAAACMQKPCRSSLHSNIIYGLHVGLFFKKVTTFRYIDPFHIQVKSVKLRKLSSNSRHVGVQASM